MPVYRVTMYMNQSVMGWSESYYTRGNVAAPSIGPQVSQLLAKRNGLMWTNQQWVGVRIAELGTSPDPLTLRRKSRVFPPGTWNVDGGALVVPEVGGLINANAYNLPHPDLVRVALQLRLTYGDGYSTTRYHVGVPDGATLTDPGTLQWSGEGGASWYSDLQSYIGLLTSQWAILARTPSTVDPYHTVSNLVRREAAPSVMGIVIPSASAPGWTDGTKIHLRGFRPKQRGIISLNGRYYVDSVNTTLRPGYVIFYLRGTETGDPNAYKILGTAQKVGFNIQSIQSVYPIRAGIHKRGRPSIAPRGRRLTRVSLDP